jgi:hypothetical protein
MNADWRAAYWRDQRFPAGIDGKTFVKGKRYEKAELSAAVKHLRKISKPAPADVWTIVRLHRVEK